MTGIFNVHSVGPWDWGNRREWGEGTCECQKVKFSKKTEDHDKFQVKTKNENHWNSQFIRLRSKMLPVLRLTVIPRCGLQISGRLCHIRTLDLAFENLISIGCFHDLYDFVGRVQVLFVPVDLPISIY